MRTARLRAVSLMIAATAIGAGSSACNAKPERSTAAFCNTFKQEAIRLHSKYQSQMDGAGGDPLSALAVGLGSLVQAEGDMVVMFDRLDKVAPPDIEPEVAAMRDASKQQVESMSHLGDNPLAALGGGLVSGLASSGSEQRVDQYLQQNCDLSFET